VLFAHTRIGWIIISGIDPYHRNTDCIRYIYWTVMQQWVHFGHKGNYFAQYKYHQVHKTIQDVRNRIQQQLEAKRQMKT
jgi:hypothetical protein